jgi:patatin-like phospholipase/acyl hydrolase
MSMTIWPVLSLDGGGIKGEMESRLIQRLESAYPFLSRIKLFAGTSTGGIIALALAAGVPIADCVTLYEESSARIFANRDFADSFSGSLDEYVRADYGQEGLRDVLVETFGTKRLPDLPVEVLVPSFDLVRFRPKYLDRTDDYSLVDAALGTSAAPTYFPVHLVRESLTGRATGRGSVRALIDGGVFCNNPSAAAIDFAKIKLGIGADQIRMLSIGAGQPPYSPPEEVLAEAIRVLDWGKRQWVVKRPHWLLKVLLDASVPSAHFSSKGNLAERYHRIQPTLPEEIALDDVSKIPLLKALADSIDISDSVSWLKKNIAA